MKWQKIEDVKITDLDFNKRYILGGKELCPITGKYFKSEIVYGEMVFDYIERNGHVTHICEITEPED